MSFMTINLGGFVFAARGLCFTIIAFIWSLVIFGAVDASETLGYFCIFAFLFFCYFSIRMKVDFYVLNSYLFYAIIGALVSLVFVNEGVLLIEINQITSINKSLINNVMLNLITIWSAQWMYERLDRFSIKLYFFDSKISSNFVYIFSAIYFLLGAFILYFGIKYGGAANFGLDRFGYWEMIGFKEGLYISSLVSQLGILIGVIHTIGFKKLSKVLFFYGLIVVFAAGHKFTGVLQLVLLYLIPIAIDKNKLTIDLSTKIKITIVGLISVACVFLYIYYTYTLLYGPENAFEMLSSRIALQSQMLWALDNFTEMWPKNLSYLIEHYFGVGNLDVNSGLYFLMYQIAPSSLVDVYYDRGVVFTTAGPGSNSFYFGYVLSLLAVLFIGWGLGAVSWILKISIKSRNLIAVVFAIKVYFNYMVFVADGDGAELLNIKLYIYLVLFAISFYSMRYFSHRTQG